MAPPEDEIIGRFAVRARRLKVGWASVVIVDRTIVQRFEAATEDEVLESARAYARTAAPPPRPASTRKPAAPKAASFTGIEAAKARFAKFFPGGFTDPAYLADERDYKVKAREKLQSIATIEQALNATPEMALKAQDVFSTNMLSVFENSRVRQVLKSEDGPAFLQAAAQVASGDSETGLPAIAALVTKHGAVSWTIATFLASLWAPETQGFFKITATRDFAAGVKDAFAEQYESAINPQTHAKFLAFMGRMKTQLAPLAPRDMIDVQSFIWVVSGYTAKDEARIAKQRAN